MKTSKRPFKKKPGVSYCGQTELTPELKLILQRFELIAFVRACSKNVVFYIVGQKPQTIEGRFKDIVCLLKCKKRLFKFHNSYMVNPDFVFVWAPHFDNLHLLMRTETDGEGKTVLTFINPEDIAGSQLTPEGVNKAELAIRLGRSHVLPVSEPFKKAFKDKLEDFPYIKRIWQIIALKPEIINVL